MRITLIGHICCDVINHPDGSKTEGFGGIFFSLVTLANILGPHDTIYPVFGVGKSEYEMLMDRLITYSNLDTSGIYKFNGKTNQVYLNYQDDEKRIECSKYLAEPIPFKKIVPFLETDMILINMVSGFDITLETLDEIRIKIRDDLIPIYMDVHSLLLGLQEDGKRYHRPVSTWRRWLFMLHAVQMNQEEALGLTTERYSEEILSRQIFSLNTEVVIITRGSLGVTVFTEEHKQLKRFDQQGINTGNVVDTTGCGDIFAAAYCGHYLKSKDIKSSVAFANEVAAYKSQIAGSLELDRLSKFRLEKFNRE